MFSDRRDIVSCPAIKQLSQYGYKHLTVHQSLVSLLSIILSLLHTTCWETIINSLSWRVGISVWFLTEYHLAISEIYTRSLLPLFWCRLFSCHPTAWLWLFCCPASSRMPFSLFVPLLDIAYSWNNMYIFLSVESGLCIYIMNISSVSVCVNELYFRLFCVGKLMYKERGLIFFFRNKNSFETCYQLIMYECKEKRKETRAVLEYFHNTFDYLCNRGYESKCFQWIKHLK